MAPKEKMPSQTPTEKNKKSVTEHVKPATPKEQAIVEERRQKAITEMLKKGLARMQVATDRLFKSSIAKDLEQLVTSAAPAGQLDTAFESFLSSVEIATGHNNKNDRRNRELRFKFLMSAVIELAPESPQMEERLKKGQINVYDLMKMALDRLLAERVTKAAPQEKRRWQGVSGTYKAILREVEASTPLSS